MIVSIGWASPAYYGWGWEWWGSASYGRGESACHLNVTVLGFHLDARLYDYRD